MSSEVTIRAQGLGKSYRRYQSEWQRLQHGVFGTDLGEDHWVLRNVDFEARAGEAIGIVGRNGAGKSTLLQIVAGTLTASEGEVAVRGRVGTLLELGAGLHRDYTGRENAYFTAAIMGMSRRQYAGVAEEIERFADIGDFFDRRVSEYSSGMFARLAFSVNIHCQPDVLIVDEILAVGDIAFQHKCIRSMRQFCAGGGTLLFVSHDDAAVRSLCDRAIWLDNGRLSSEGATAHVLRHYHEGAWKHQFGAANFVASGEEGAPVPPPWEDDAPRPAEVQRFDPEALAEHLVAGGFTGVELCGPGGAPLAMAQGGSRMELKAVVCPEVTVEAPVVCFMLRNRLAQVVFGARTDTDSLGLKALPALSEAMAHFAFTLPHVLSGEYTIELVLVARVGGQDRIVLRHPPILLPVRTTHIGQGVANVAMAEVSVDVRNEEALT